MNCFSAPSSRPTASQVSAIVVNRRALVFETGAMMRAASSSSLKNAGSSVAGSARLRATGSRWPNSRGASSTVRPTAAPRPANASPKPCRLSRLASRVFWSNILKTSSRSTLTSVCSSGTVSPSWNAVFELPSVSSRYLRPSAERGRMRQRESSGIFPIVLSSLSFSSAPACPAESFTGFMSSTTPMRKPPERISLPRTRFWPLAKRTFSDVVGTNGSPLFAL